MIAEIKSTQVNLVEKRKSYLPPNLVVLGRLSALVQAGSKNQPEGRPGQGDMEKA